MSGIIISLPFFTISSYKKLKKQIPLNITIYDSAVWIEDGTISFNQEYAQSPNGEWDYAGVMSSIDGVGIKPPGNKNKMTPFLNS